MHNLTYASSIHQTVCLLRAGVCSSRLGVDQARIRLLAHLNVYLNWARVQVLVHHNVHSPTEQASTSKIIPPDTLASNPFYSQETVGRSQELQRPRVGHENVADTRGAGARARNNHGGDDDYGDVDDGDGGNGGNGDNGGNDGDSQGDENNIPGFHTMVLKVLPSHASLPTYIHVFVSLTRVVDPR